MKKIISLISALAISAAAFSAMTVTSFAAPAANSEPKIQVWADGYDADDYIVLKAKLINNEALNYSISKGKVTSNGINMIQVGITLDSDVFDTTETYITPSTSGINVSGDNTASLTYLASPTTVDTYWTTVPEYLFEIAVWPQDGTTLENIPADAIKFDTTIVEYTSYTAQKPAESTPAFYTIYANDATVAAGGSRDYDLACKFTGTSTEWPEEGGEGEETAEAMAAGVAVTEGVYAGMTSASTDVVAADELVKIVISNDVDTSKTLEWEAPATLGDGKSNVLAVLLYDADAMKDSTFTVKFLGAADALIKAFTHIVE